MLFHQSQRGGLLLAVIANRDADEEAGVEGDHGASYRSTRANACSSGNGGMPRPNPGHSTTQVYAHLDFQHLAKVYDATRPEAGRTRSPSDGKPAPEGPGRPPRDRT